MTGVLVFINSFGLIKISFISIFYAKSTGVYRYSIVFFLTPLSLKPSQCALRLLYDPGIKSPSLPPRLRLSSFKPSLSMQTSSLGHF